MRASHLPSPSVSGSGLEFCRTVCGDVRGQSVVLSTLQSLAFSVCTCAFVHMRVYVPVLATMNFVKNFVI